MNLFDVLVNYQCGTNPSYHTKQSDLTLLLLI